MPNENGRLSEAEQRSVIQWMADHGVANSCQVCSHAWEEQSDFHVLRIVIVSDIFNGTKLTGKYANPVVPVVCLNCGNQILFSAVLLGLVKMGGPKMPKPSYPDPETIAELGAIIQTSYDRRDMKAYPIYEHELRTLTLTNLLVGLFASVGSVFFGFAVSLVVDWIIQGKLTDKGTLLLQIGAPTTAIAALVFFAASYLVYQRRESLIDVIQKESAPIVQSTPETLDEEPEQSP